MTLGERWKEVGGELGTAFGTLGKALLKAAEEKGSQAEKWVNEKLPTKEAPAAEAQSEESTEAAEVVEAPAEEAAPAIDWKQTGSDISNALKDLGRVAIRSVKVGVDFVDDWANKQPAPKAEEVADNAVAEEVAEAVAEIMEEEKPAEEPAEAPAEE